MNAQSLQTLQTNSREIPRNYEEAPQNNSAFVDFGEDDVCVEVLFDGCAFEQCVDFFLYGERVTWEQILDKQIFAGNEPLRQELFDLAEEEEPAPSSRVVRRNIAEIVTIEKGAQGVHMIAQSGFFHESGNFGVLETETCVELGIEALGQAHIVEPRENSFAPNARHDCLFEVLSVLQRAYEILAKDLQDAYEIYMRIASVNRSIVFVNEHDGVLALNVAVDIVVNGVAPYRIEVTCVASIEVPVQTGPLFDVQLSKQESNPASAIVASPDVARPSHPHVVESAPQFVVASFDRSQRQRQTDRRAKLPRWRQPKQLESVKVDEVLHPMPFVDVTLKVANVANAVGASRILM